MKNIGEELDEIISTLVDSGLTLKEVVEEVEKIYLLKALERNGWNLKKTSKKIGIHRNTLSMKLKKYGIKKKS